MRSWWLILLATAVWAAGPKEESTRYQVSWPSGISLGEGQLQATKDGDQWKFTLKLEAAIPGFKVEDTFHSTVDGKLCSLQLVKESTHGARKTKETSTFAATTGTRVTSGGGGKSEFPVPACAHDALGFLFVVRDELAQGKVPAPRQIFFGAAYDVRLRLVGSERVIVGEVPTETDHFKIAVKGPSSRFEFDAYFAKDEGRTLAMVRIPFAMGSFALEWVR